MSGRSLQRRSAAARRARLLVVSLIAVAGLAAMAWLLLLGLPSWQAGRVSTAGVVVLLLTAATIAVLVYDLMADLRAQKRSRRR
jgi:hypothetical protein